MVSGLDGLVKVLIDNIVPYMSVYMYICIYTRDTPNTPGKFRIFLDSSSVFFRCRRIGEVSRYNADAASLPDSSSLVLAYRVRGVGCG